MTSKPLSIESEEFLGPVKQALAASKELLVLHRPAYAAGRRYWYLINNWEDFLQILATKKRRSSFTVFDSEFVLPLRGIANEAMKQQTLELLRIHKEVFMAEKVEGQTEIDDRGSDEEVHIEEWFAEHPGVFAIIGPDLDWNQDIANGYVPDADGTVHPGAY